MNMRRPAEPDLSTLEHRLGHRFADRSLLRQALSHRSFAAERVGGAAPLCDQNEQLEHLGDSVLGFVVSEYLFRRFTAVPEGRLTQMKAELVNANHLYRTALRLELGGFLLLGKTEEVNGGRAKKALLANAVEALIAALYLDGGLERVRRFVLSEIVGDFSPFEPLPDISAADYKGALQELARMKKLPAPHYAVIQEEGPQHAKTFTVEVRVGEGFISRADGSTKKAASQLAAQYVLEQITAPSSSMP